MNIKAIVMGSVAAIFLLGSGLAVFSAEAGASFPGQDPSSLISRSIADAESASWVHEHISGSADGYAFTANNEVGAYDGQQAVQEDGSRAQVILVNGIAYIEANTKGITDYFLLTTSDPQQLAGKWLSVTPTDPGYSTYVAAVTLRSDFSEIHLVGPFTSGPQTRISGRNAIPLHGFVPLPSKEVPATLYVTATRQPLPVKYVVSDHSNRETILWTDWNHPVYLSTPTDSEPIPNQ